MHGLPEDRDHADKAVFPQHWNEQKRAGPAQFDQFHNRREAGEVSRLLLDINDMNELLGGYQPPQRVDRRRVDDRIARESFRERRRQIEHRDETEAATVVENQQAELRLAY